jgi:molybdenum cofactor guanylyltransferase
MKKNETREPTPLEVCILAGGLSTRMGRDKARLRLNGKSLLTQVRDAARTLGCPVRVIRRDLVTRCGPMGGVFTALKTSRAKAVLFLACDMPFVSTELLKEITSRITLNRPAVFVTLNGLAGFPFVIRTSALLIVEDQIASGRFSLQELASALDARRLRVIKARQAELRNLNTPEEMRAVG